MDMVRGPSDREMSTGRMPRSRNRRGASLLDRASRSPSRKSGMGPSRRKCRVRRWPKPSGDVMSRLRRRRRRPKGRMYHWPAPALRPEDPRPWVCPESASPRAQAARPRRPLHRADR